MPASRVRHPDARVALALVLALVGVFCGCGGYSPIQTHFNKGVYHFSKQNWGEAIDEYRAALAEDPDDHRARFNLGATYEAQADQIQEVARVRLAYFERHRDPESAARLREESDAKAADLRRLAITEYGELLRRKPGDMRASINLAAHRRLQGGDGVEQAIRDLETLVPQNPRALAPRLALASHLLESFRASNQEDRLARALEVLEDAQGIAATSPEVNMLLGESKELLGLFEEARGAYQTVLQRDANDIGALRALGELELAAGRSGEARTFYERVISIQPNDFSAHLRLSKLAEARGELEAALRHLWQARAADDGLHPGTPSPDYDASLRELYQRLAAQ